MSKVEYKKYSCNSQDARVRSKGDFQIAHHPLVLGSTKPELPRIGFSVLTRTMSPCVYCAPCMKESGTYKSLAKKKKQRTRIFHTIVVVRIELPLIGLLFS